MKPLHYFLLLSVFIYVGCSDDHEEPQPLVDKEIQFKIYSNKDYTDETYANHYVMVNVAALIMTYDPYKEEYIMDQSTDWIALKDIPSFDSPIIFEGLAEKVNESKQTVVVGYSYTLKIGEYTESYGKNDFIDKRETQKIVPIVF